jgi:methionine synthase II (cobalamin-independent)
MTHRATGIGSMPGTDFREVADAVIGELDALPFLPELPDRGVHAAMIGRTASLVTELGVDLQPAGWRLTGASGIDHRRAASLLAHDLDVVEELAAGRSGAFKIQLAGPWTMAAAIERPRGDKVIGDHGARRDLAQALADGVGVHVAEVVRRLGPNRLEVQVDEPSLPTVLAGGVPTASGFHRHRSVAPDEAAQALDWVFDAIASGGGNPVVHCCDAAVPIDVLAKTSATALSFDLELMPSSSFDRLGEWLDAGRQLWLGVVPTIEPAMSPPTAADVTRRVLGWWTDLGFGDADALPPTTVTPSCGLAGASPSWARAALDLSTTVARNLSEEGGKIGP